MIQAIVIDDEELFLRYFKTFIDWEKYGICIVATAKNGRDALELCANIQVDVCFVDINMPILNGIEFAKEVRRLKKHIEIILITGHNEFEYAQQAIKVGVLDYILKPVEEEEFMDVLSVLIEKFNEQTPMNQIQLPDGISSSKKITRSSLLAQKAKRLIDERFAVPETSVKSIADALYVNPSYLRLVFKKQYSVTVLEYINNLRMEKAKSLITSKNVKLCDICHEAGFNDAAYFSKSFKKHFGIAPSEFSNIVHGLPH